MIIHREITEMRGADDYEELPSPQKTARWISQQELVDRPFTGYRPLFERCWCGRPEGHKTSAHPERDS